LNVINRNISDKTTNKATENNAMKINSFSDIKSFLL